MKKRCVLTPVSPSVMACSCAFWKVSALCSAPAIKSASVCSSRISSSRKFAGLAALHVKHAMQLIGIENRQAPRPTPYPAAAVSAPHPRYSHRVKRHLPGARHVPDQPGAQRSRRPNAPRRLARLRLHHHFACSSNRARRFRCGRKSALLPVAPRFLPASRRDSAWRWRSAKYCSAASDGATLVRSSLEQPRIFNRDARFAGQHAQQSPDALHRTCALASEKTAIAPMARS